MREVSLTLVQTFYVVAKHGSFSAAARSLGITYQSAANHVRRLEQFLGSALISSEQGAKSVELTPRARSLYLLLQPEFDVMFSRLAQILEKERPILRVGMPQAIFYYLMPPVLSELRKLFAEIEIVSYERDTALAAMVMDGSLDVCLSERYFGDGGVPQHLIGTYKLALIVPKSWGPLPKLEGIPLWARNRPFVTYEPGQTIRNLAMDFLTLDGCPPNVAISTSGSSSVKKCVEAGQGYALIPAWCIDDGDALLNIMPIESLPEIPIYFGQALYMVNNPYVSTMRRLCSEIFLSKL